MKQLISHHLNPIAAQETKTLKALLNKQILDSSHLTCNPKQADLSCNNVAASPLAALTKYPTPLAANPPQMSAAEKIAYIAVRFREIMEALGLDLSDESLEQTPQRVAKMYVNEVFAGLDPQNFPAISCFENRYQHEGKSAMVFLKVSFHSFCEHHFVPMNGYAYVAYVPNCKIIGLSKIPRLVRFFASRPQLQERLTAQVADSLAILLETEDVAVSINAEHFCVMARGIQDSDSHTTTNVLRGNFDANASLRNEFFEAINRK